MSPLAIAGDKLEKVNVEPPQQYEKITYSFIAY
jgi:hypothetical protein